MTPEVFAGAPKTSGVTFGRILETRGCGGRPRLAILTAVSARSACPIRLRRAPFRGSAAVAAGLLTRTRLAGAEWRRLLPDVYLHADVVPDQLTWCRAALLAAPEGAALGYRSALGLYCPALRPGDEAPVDLVVPSSTSPRSHPRLRVHRLRTEPADLERFAGFPVTTPARTGFDLARGEDVFEAVAAVDALLNRGLTSVEQISGYLWRCLPGRSRAARALALSSPGAESPMETRTRLLVVLAGLPTPRTQYRVYDGDGFVARLDLAYPGRRIGIEYDGDQHRERAAFRYDAVRANRLRLAGWCVLRFTVDDVLRHPDRVVRQVAALLGG